MRWIDQNGKFFTPPLVIGGAAHHSPTPELLRRAGYTPYVPPAPPTRTVYKFDRYKVILALGDGWEIKKGELEAAGLYDAFMASPYLSTADEIFGPIYEGLSREEKRILHRECRYGK